VVHDKAGQFVLTLAVVKNFTRERCAVDASIAELDSRHLIPCEHFFMLLSVARCAPMLPAIGIPLPFACRPPRMVAIVAEFHERRRGVSTHPNDVERVRDVLRMTFNDLATEFGHEEARRLYKWGMNHMIMANRESTFRQWSSVFAGHAKRLVLGTIDPDRLSLPPAETTQFEGLLLASYHPEILWNEEEEIANLASIPLSAAERRLVAMEVTQPGDFAEVDLLEIMAGVLWCEKACRCFTQMRAWMADAQYAALLALARKVRRERGMSAEAVADIHLPRPEWLE
jgi:hypothetical protein